MSCRHSSFIGFYIDKEWILLAQNETLRGYKLNARIPGLCITRKHTTNCQKNMHTTNINVHTQRNTSAKSKVIQNQKNAKSRKIKGEEKTRSDQNNN